MDIEHTIREFLDWVLNEETAREDLDKLIAALDKIAYSVSTINFAFDDTKYPDPPKKDYQIIREQIQKKFTGLGFYSIPSDVSENLDKSELVIGDAIDDITDIVCDLSEVIWYFENTSTSDALWHYQYSFKTHWGKHLRELQWYLHDKCCEAIT